LAEEDQKKQFNSLCRGNLSKLIQSKRYNCYYNLLCSKECKCCCGK